MKRAVKISQIACLNNTVYFSRKARHYQVYPLEIEHKYVFNIVSKVQVGLGKVRYQTVSKVCNHGNRYYTLFIKNSIVSVHSNCFNDEHCNFIPAN